MAERASYPKQTKRSARIKFALTKPTVQSLTKPKSTTMEYAEYNPSKNQLQEPKEPELQKQYRRTYQLRKTWKIAQWHHRGKFNAGMNLAIENAFNRIREQIKMLYAQHGEYFYDHDLREDYTENTDTIHAIACSTLYMSLDCHPSFEYEVYYNIDSSPFKVQIAALIEHGFSPGVAKPFDRVVSIETYFLHIRSYWRDNPEHFGYL